jgi:hypothetical protein
MKLSKISSLSLAAVLAVMVAGCATKPPKVNTEFDSQADFKEAKTFAVLPLPKSIPGADPGLAMRVSGTVENTIRAAMTAKGYTEVEKADADIAVLLHGKLVPKTDVTDWGFTPSYGAYGWNRGYRGYYGGMYAGSSVSVDQYNEGTMIAEVYDVDSKSMIWVGWITGRANQKREGEQERVSMNVDRILALYPPMGAAPIGDEMMSN